MLDKTQYSSWVSRMLLYIKGKESGKVLVDSLINEPFQYRTVTDTETLTTSTIVRARRYDELTDVEKLREACDIKATNIILQGLPQDIYNLVNHHEEAKHIWDSVKLLIEDSKISLEERESKLYDEFDMFTSVPGETIHSLALLEVYVCLFGPTEAHANEVRTMKEPFLNPLALVANTYNFSPSYTNQTQYHQELTPFAQKQVLPIASQQLNDVPMVQQRS
ncbi:hypothetical protein Tco_1110848 [Tanacetum coccineum]|uniref:Integrase, catalytic region, zinc finger, CCHC-type, peptidase aspartic, catalytic n=1 Tax=Tanacetum coccineum TaxID=301880 RepID=A0ABQ5IK00_9ASTR